MSQFRKKPVVITAITFDQLVAHGIDQCKAEGRESNIVNGMPWSFSYAGHHVTHENDDCYLIPTLEGTMQMGRDDMLITGVKGEIYPCKRDIFNATYEAAPTALPVIDPGPDSLEREIQAKASTAPRVTPEDVQAEITAETYTVLPSGRTTICELTLTNGFTVRGESSVVHIENFNAEIGRKVARLDATEKIWQLLGFRLRDDLARQVLTEADALVDLKGTPRSSVRTG